MQRTLALLVVITIAVSCTMAERTPPPEPRPSAVPEALLASPPPDPTIVSMLQLIADPERHDGKPILVVGFAHIELEGHGLYLHRQDYEEALHTNAVWLDVDPRPEFTALNGRYILVEGVFDARRMGMSGSFMGAIRQISRYEPFPTRVERERLR